VVVLTLGHGSGCADGCGGGCDGTCEPPADPTGGVRVPVLACRDALRAGGAAVTLTEANSDTDIDTVLARLPATPGRPLTLSRPATAGRPLMLSRSLTAGRVPPLPWRRTALAGSRCGWWWR
jgi:hypothetical protein